MTRSGHRFFQRRRHACVRGRRSVRLRLLDERRVQAFASSLLPLLSGVEDHLMQMCQIAATDSGRS
jgi:hypothetical protein